MYNSANIYDSTETKEPPGIDVREEINVSKLIIGKGSSIVSSNWVFAMYGTNSKDNSVSPAFITHIINK